MFSLITTLPIPLYKDIENIRSHHSFIRKKMLNFVICSIDCEQSLFSLDLLTGVPLPSCAFSHARGRLCLLRVLLDETMPAVCLL